VSQNQRPYESSRTGHGVSRLRDLRRQARLELDRPRRLERVRLPDDRVRDKEGVDSCIREIYRVRPRRSGGSLPRPVRDDSDQPLYVNQRYSPRISGQATVVRD